jgi:integrase
VRLRAGTDGPSKTWYHCYRFAGQKRREPLGRLCDLSLNDARMLVGRRARDMAEAFVDPRAKRSEAAAKAEHAANTPLFFDGVAQFLEDYRNRVRPATLRNTTGWLLGPLGGGTAYCEPLKKKRLDLITDRDIANLIAGLQKARSRHVAQAVRAALQSFFSWGCGRRFISVSPCAGVYCPAAPRELAKRKKRVLETSEIVAVWNACDQIGEYGTITRLTILMGVRRQEIGAMRWSELDLDAAVWTIPAERTKTHAAYATPLAPAVVAILRSIERRDGRDQVFGARSNAGFVSFSDGKAKLDAAAGIEPWRFHDLRSTIVTRMGKDLKILPHVRAAVLNHAGERTITREFYDDTDYAPEKREALEKWADYVLGLVSGKVVQLQRAA